MTSEINTYQGSFALRRVVGPYAFWPVIMSVVIIIWLPYVFRTHDVTPLKAIVAVFIILVSPIIYMGSRYRIWWQDNSIVLRAGGFAGIMVTMRVEDIERVEQEASN